MKIGFAEVFVGFLFVVMIAAFSLAMLGSWYEYVEMPREHVCVEKSKPSMPGHGYCVKWVKK